jgi:DNA-binding HxlR family transcriptional regulator
MSVNEIYKKTSLEHKEIFKKTGLSYKKNFTDTLKELEKDKIIKREKDPKKHKQREYLSLTDLGFELLEIKKGLDDYIVTSKKLYEREKKLEDINKIKDKSLMKNKLRLMGWNEEDIRWFKDTYEGISYINYLADLEIYGSFIHRYFLLLSKFNKFKLGEISKMIMNSLLIEVTNFKMEKIYDALEDSSETRIDSYKVIIDQQLGSISGYHYFFPNFFNDEIKNHIIARLCLLNPPKNLISKKLEFYKDSIEFFKTYSSEQLKEEDKLVHLKSKCLIDSYKEYLHLKTN